MAHSSKPNEDRRAFLERAGKTALMAPAAALLLSAANTSAMADQYGKGKGKDKGKGHSDEN